MITREKLVRANEWLTCTDMTIVEAAKALDVDPMGLQMALKRTKKNGYSAMSQIHSVLSDFGSMTAKKIAQMLSCSQAHVTNNLRLLIDSGEVEKVGGRIPIYKIKAL